jgi:hypothetical protein
MGQKVNPQNTKHCFFHYDAALAIVLCNVTAVFNNLPVRNVAAIANSVLQHITIKQFAGRHTAKTIYRKIHQN